MCKSILSSVLRVLLIAGLAIGAIATPSLLGTPAAAAQEIDAEVPPGNPVIGSDRPGDSEAEGGTNYALWSLVAVCLIAAGWLLITIERWEARRLEEAERASRV